ncbi:MAG: serine/threonine protein kinase [Candidatus Rokuibacteriota bacterium]|nr:MAG: serine/threonine protein kinase [Candidatus Rokubacteria bacterium]
MPTALVGGRYRIEGQLGGGGMAIVYAARDERLGRPVAIKVLADNLAADSEIRRRFLLESRIAASLSHPNIVKIYDSGEDGRPYIVMERVDGCTLGQELRRRGAFPPGEAAAVAAQAAEGLAYAHAAGIVHRDIKPDNLLLDSRGTLKITDFGIAHALESTRLTATGTVLGTAAYLAPEQARGEAVTPATDVYALGAVLYELLTGEPPHGGATLGELLVRKLDQPPPLPGVLAPGVPSGLDAATERCLAAEPRDRPTAAELRRVLTGDAEALTRILRAGDSPRGRRRPRTQRRVWIGVTAAAIGLGALSLWLAASFGSSPATTSKPSPPVGVVPVPRGATPAARAHNLARWLRRYSSG